ncbi:MAG: hypothetical protein WB613_13450, partial [Pseudolabrys sp.]
TRKFRCEPILLVYLENARGNSSRAFRNKVPRHCSSADENGFGLPLASNLYPLQFAETVRCKIRIKLNKFGARQDFHARHRDAPRYWQETKPQGESPQVIRGVMS